MTKQPGGDPHARTFTRHRTAVESRRSEPHKCVVPVYHSSGIAPGLGTLSRLAGAVGTRADDPRAEPDRMPSEMAEQEMEGVSSQSQQPASVVVIGAGPAGLTAAFELMKHGTASTVTILEADDVVGGISQTVVRDGWRFDIGGHRFFTKVGAVDALWDEILAPEKMLDRPRQSRLMYRGKFYDYPLVPMKALRTLGPVEAVRCVGSYLWVRVRPPKNRDTLEGFMAARFGWRLYRHFFKT